MALIAAAPVGVVPPAPPERIPGRLVGDGTSLRVVASGGSMLARGIA